jgi:hypothetical protein
MGSIWARSGQRGEDQGDDGQVDEAMGEVQHDLG